MTDTHGSGGRDGDAGPIASAGDIDAAAIPGAEAGPSAPVAPGAADDHAAAVPVGPAVRLRPPRHPVDRRAIALWSVRAALNALVVLAVLAIVAAIASPSGPVLAVAGAAAVVAGVAYVAGMPRLRYRVHRWEVTGEAVYTASGWLTHEWRVAPLSRVQTVDARRSPLDQLFGLSSVRITTASASGDVAIDGLDHHLAADLVETLTARTQATAGDAT